MVILFAKALPRLGPGHMTSAKFQSFGPLTRVILTPLKTSSHFWDPLLNYMSSTGLPQV